MHVMYVFDVKHVSKKKKKESKKNKDLRHIHMKPTGN